MRNLGLEALKYSVSEGSYSRPDNVPDRVISAAWRG